MAKPREHPTSETTARHVHDVLIVGGGPGGATLAALLAERGHDVLLLDKDRHPRFHIGESLLPANVELFERLGVLDGVRELGVRKAGADFNTFSREYDPPRHDADFRRQLDRGKPAYAFEVRRSELDHLLLQHCRSRGAEVREATRVTRVDLSAGRPPVVHARREDGGHETIQAHFIVDASGRETLLANQLGIKQRSRTHNSAALYAHYGQVERRQADRSGNLSLYWFEHGWIWLIPLRDGAMSVGAVCNPDYLKRGAANPEDLLRRTLRLGPDELRRRMRRAERLTPVTATGNYSYQSGQIAGDRWLMIGDAYAFVDPVFSSGVLLAMQSAFEVVPAIDASLRGDDRGYRQAIAAYRRRHQRALDVFSWFIERFHTPAMKQLLMRPSNPLRVQEAVISMLTGDVFDNPGVYRRLALFKLIYAVTSARFPRGSWRQLRQRRTNTRAAIADAPGPRDPEP